MDSSFLLLRPWHTRLELVETIEVGALVILIEVVIGAMLMTIFARMAPAFRARRITESLTTQSLVTLLYWDLMALLIRFSTGRGVTFIHKKVLC
ncbi:hypothetical protein MOMUL_17760 [Moorella mulderi DSM 14980]|uniref:Uncharacterized protein n=1 Tax=Moorella mulderi DSM 14980 TaxID=1122241 RepID=A0A151AX46_9FIRM|nr:hypothetical protein MOMUL_17760 [Moorella mulderi DSM 14980]